MAERRINDKEFDSLLADIGDLAKGIRDNKFPKECLIGEIKTMMFYIKQKQDEGKRYPRVIG